MKKHFKQTIAVALLFSLVITQTGCFSLAVEQIHVPNIDHPVFTDVIIAAGKPDEASLKKIGASDALVFIGSRYSYLLLAGIEPLMKISRNLEGQYIFIKQPSHSLFYKDNQFWGTLKVGYKYPGELTAKQTEILGDLGFQKERNGIYLIDIEISGLRFAKTEIPPNQNKALQMKHEIYFYNPPGSVVLPAIGKAILTPVAFAADIITSPVQILGLMYLALQLSHIGG